MYVIWEKDFLKLLMFDHISHFSSGAQLEMFLKTALMYNMTEAHSMASESLAMKDIFKIYFRPLF